MIKCKFVLSLDSNRLAYFSTALCNIYRCLLINSTFATFSSNKFEPVKPLLIFKGKPTTPESKLSDRQEARMEFGRDEKQQHNKKQEGKFKARSANR